MKKIATLLCLGIFTSAGAALAGPQDFVLVNESASDICYVYVSSQNTQSWEEDVLGADECLESGEAMMISFNAGNEAMWDLRVQDNEGNYEDYQGFNLNQISKITIHGGGEASYE
ncbi:hypothetical protein C4J81_05980 [Deltaproteobacteria bacterium Smac51]|nr:hypothetical protein C4J81_05980 [Deltaproteobacteria bacterium Smac51]